MLQPLFLLVAISVLKPTLYGTLEVGLTMLHWKCVMKGKLPVNMNRVG